MSTLDRSGPLRMGVTLRRGEIVSPLELFFDLVFVLAITQPTALIRSSGRRPPPWWAAWRCPPHHVAFKLRVLGVLSRHRLAVALVLLAFVPLAHRLQPLVTVGVVATVLWLSFAIEAVHHGEARREIRQAEHLRHSGD